MDRDQKTAEQASRSTASEAFRYVRPEAAKAPAFQSLNITAEDIRKANEKRDALLEAVQARFTV